MYDDLYCKVFLYSELETDELCRYINRKVSGKLEPFRTIITDWGELDLCRNSYFDSWELENNPEDFVFWQYYLDIEPKRDVDQTCYIAQIANLLKQLHSENIKAVASCDFEDAL